MNLTDTDFHLNKPDRLTNRKPLRHEKQNMATYEKTNVFLNAVGCRSEMSQLHTIMKAYNTTMYLKYNVKSKMFER